MLLGGIGLVLVVTIATLAGSGPPAGGDRPFQAATGGVGLSSSVSVTWSFFELDPRTSACCENELWPVPGLACPNPAHGAGITDFPPLAPFAAE